MSDLVPTLRVAARTEPSALAGAIGYALRDAEVVELVAVGSDAIASAVKGIAVVRGPLVTRGMDVSVVPRWSEFPDETDGRQISAITLRVTRVPA